MTLGKCPYSARWLHWGLPSPEQISGTCAAFLAGLPPSQPYHSPLLCGANPKASEDWLALAKAAAQVSWEPPRPSPGPRAKVSRWACLALNCCAATWNRCQVGAEWAGRVGGGSVFIYFGFFFSACVIITAAVIEAPMIPHVSRGVLPLLCLIPPSPSYFTGCNGSLGRSRLLLKVTAGETGVRIQIQVCLT